MTNTKFADNITMPNGDNILLQDRLATTNIEQLETNLSNEVTRATEKENTLQASIDSVETTVNQLKGETFIEQQTDFGNLGIQKCGEIVHCVLWFGEAPSDIETDNQVAITTTLPYPIKANTINVCSMTQDSHCVALGYPSKPNTLTFANYSGKTIEKGTVISFELTYITEL